MDVAPNVTNYIQCRVNKENLITISLQIQFCVTVSDVRSSQFLSVFTYNTIVATLSLTSQHTTVDGLTQFCINLKRIGKII